VQQILFQWLLREAPLPIHSIDAQDPDLYDYHQIPDTGSLSGRLRSCLQESESVPRDFTKLFDETLFKFDTNLIPEAFELYGKMRVNKAPLTLIQPQFEIPQPPLNAAVFPPQLREPPCPSLDLYDLDDEFASERIRLAQLANKCREGQASDLEFFVNEATNIVTQGMGDEVPMRYGTAESQAKQSLFFLMTKLASWKKLHDDSNQGPMGGMDGGQFIGGGIQSPGMGNSPFSQDWDGPSAMQQGGLGGQGGGMMGPGPMGPPGGGPGQWAE